MVVIIDNALLLILLQVHMEMHYDNDAQEIQLVKQQQWFFNFSFILPNEYLADNSLHLNSSHPMSKVAAVPMRVTLCIAAPNHGVHMYQTVQ